MTCWPDLRRLTAGLTCLAAVASMQSEPATFLTRIAPVLEQHCTGCHGEKKQKAGLRLDSYEGIMLGSEEQPVISPGDLRNSELFRRVTLPAGHEDVMPSDGKPLLSATEIILLEKWISAGASGTGTFEAPALVPSVVTLPAAPDYRTRLAAAIALGQKQGVRLVPRSGVPTDGLVLRTASAPARCNDAVLTQLTPFADLIVEAELARTKITDAGLVAIKSWSNLRVLDLTQTAVTSRGLRELVSLEKLETLNLTETQVDQAGVAELRSLPAMREVWSYGTPAEPVE